MFDNAKKMYELQKKARKIKEDLKKTHIEAEHEGVIITINGEQKVVDVAITDEAMQNKGKLEENLLKTFNKGVKKSQELGAEKMKEIMGGGFPGLGG